jgi:hypothetical protein
MSCNEGNEHSAQKEYEGCDEEFSINFCSPYDPIGIFCNKNWFPFYRECLDTVDTLVPKPEIAGVVLWFFSGVHGTHPGPHQMERREFPQASGLS